MVFEICIVWDSLCIDELSARLGDWTAELARRLNPVVDHKFGIRDGFGVRLTVCHTARQLWNFNDEEPSSLLQ